MKWYRNTIKMEVQRWKFVLIIVFTVIGEVSLFVFEVVGIDVIAICNVVLDIMTVIGIGSAFVQMHVSDIMKQHFENQTIFLYEGKYSM